MPDGFERSRLRLQHVDAEHVLHLLHLVGPVDDEIGPPGVFVPHKSPVDPEDEIEEEDERRDEVDKADRAKPVPEGGLRRALQRGRAADQVSGHGEDDYAERVDPVVEADGKLPDVDPSKAG